ncbi:MAG: cation-transporting P-type ATPase [Sulfuritalea sp.]|nr:cation-transporting P-type ATPase [Sulfuritalea sp.]
MHIHALSAEQSLASLNTTAAGLAPAEAARRLAEFGPNHVEEVEREHLLLGFAREFTHFFAIILWIGAALAFLADQFDPGQGMGRLGIAIVGVIIVNGVFSFWQEYKAEQAVAALRRLLPQKVRALRGGETVEMLAGGLALRRQPRPARSPVPSGDLGLPRDHRGDADDERDAVPPPAQVVVRRGTLQQPLHPARARGGAGRDPVHHLYRRRQLAVRHRADRHRGLAAGAGRCGADVAAGGNPQGLAAAAAGAQVRRLSYSAK